MGLRYYNDLQAVYDDSMVFRIYEEHNRIDMGVDFVMKIVKESVSMIYGNTKFMKCYEVHKDDTGREHVYFNMHHFIDDDEVLRLFFSMICIKLPAPLDSDFLDKYSYGDAGTYGLWTKLYTHLAHVRTSSIEEAKRIKGLQQVALRTNMLESSELATLEKAMVFDVPLFDSFLKNWIDANMRYFQLSDYIHKHCNMDMMTGFLHSLDTDKTVDYGSLFSKRKYSVIFHCKNFLYRGITDGEVFYDYKRFFAAKTMTSLYDHVLHDDIYKLGRLNISNMIDMTLDGFVLEVNKDGFGGYDIVCTYTF